MRSVILIIILVSFAHVSSAKANEINNSENFYRYMMKNGGIFSNCQKYMDSAEELSFVFSLSLMASPIGIPLSVEDCQSDLGGDGYYFKYNGIGVDGDDKIRIIEDIINDDVDATFCKIKSKIISSSYYIRMKRGDRRVFLYCYSKFLAISVGLKYKNRDEFFKNPENGSGSHVIADLIRKVDRAYPR